MDIPNFLSPFQCAEPPTDCDGSSLLHLHAGALPAPPSPTSARERCGLLGKEVVKIFMMGYTLQ